MQYPQAGRYQFSPPFPHLRRELDCLAVPSSGSISVQPRVTTAQQQMKQPCSTLKRVDISSARRSQLESLYAGFFLQSPQAGRYQFSQMSHYASSIKQRTCSTLKRVDISSARTGCTSSRSTSHLQYPQAGRYQFSQANMPHVCITCNLQYPQAGRYQFSLISQSRNGEITLSCSPLKRVDISSATY